MPSNVIKTCKIAFTNCKQLLKINFENDSKLQIIENEVFSSISIELIKNQSNINRIS